MMKTLDEMLTVVTTAACASIPGIDYASVSISYGNDDLDTVGATDPRALKADALQYELRQGPCLDALRVAGGVRSEDVRADERWPRYSGRVGELGVAAQVSLRLPTDVMSAGLNLYSMSPGGLDRQTMSLATVFASQAVSVVVLASQAETLAEQLTSRQVISQAIGIVMEGQGMDEQSAFQQLVSTSQASQVKVRKLAHELVDRANSRYSR